MKLLISKYNKGWEFSYIIKSFFPQKCAPAKQRIFELIYCTCDRGNKNQLTCDYYKTPLFHTTATLGRRTVAEALDTHTHKKKSKYTSCYLCNLALKNSLISASELTKGLWMEIVSMAAHTVWRTPYEVTVYRQPKVKINLQNMKECKMKHFKRP